MKIACQNALAGAGSMTEQFIRLKQWGFEGVEISSWDKLDGCRCKALLAREDEIKRAMDKSGLPVTSICGGIHFEFLDINADKRRADCERMANVLQLAGRLGAGGVVMVPIFHGLFNAVTPPPDLSPWKTSLEVQKEILVAQLRELSKIAVAAKTQIILEPLNRYEAPWLNRLEDGAALCQRVNAKGIGLMADFFHMNIEETDPAAAIKKHAKFLVHVHLADNTRRQPGTGTTDFAAGFAALKAIKYRGAMAFECGIAGDPAKTIPQSVAWLKELRDAA